MASETVYENGALVCNIHKTPISKKHGRFFCRKCNREEQQALREEQINRNQTDIAYQNDVRFG